MFYFSYPVRPDIPDFSDLRIAEGVFTFPKHGGRPSRYPLGVNGVFYACSLGPIGGASDCFDNNTREAVRGDFGRVYWYTQKGKFGVKYRVALQIVVGHQKLKDYSMQQKTLTETYNLEIPVMLSLASFLMATVVVYTYLRHRYKKFNS